MRTADFDYPLPEELIAQQPAARRDGSRLLALDRASGALAHHRFTALPRLLRAGDLLVFNNSRVIPARLRGRNERTGGRFEILLGEEAAPNDWWVMLKPGRRARPGTVITLLDHHGANSGVVAEVTAVNDEGHRRLRFRGVASVFDELSRLGEPPLPPYIRRAPDAARREDEQRYQTIYARAPGSLAAPTAGLHFTPEVLAALAGRGIESAFVTLHVGLGTFAPVKVEHLERHLMHAERFEVDAPTAAAIQAARAQGRRVLAVGTTTLRVLESIARERDGVVTSGAGRTRLFIYPPARFHVVDGLLTNFHLPCSTLLMLVSAFAAPGEVRGRDLVLDTYAEAVRERYRFFSYGDAMLLT